MYTYIFVYILYHLYIFFCVCASQASRAAPGPMPLRQGSGGLGPVAVAVLDWRINGSPEPFDAVGQGANRETATEPEGVLYRWQIAVQTMREKGVPRGYNPQRFRDRGAQPSDLLASTRRGQLLGQSSLLHRFQSAGFGKPPPFRACWYLWHLCAVWQLHSRDDDRRRHGSSLWLAH